MGKFGSAILSGAMIVSMCGHGHAGLLVIGSGITGDDAVANGASMWSLVGGVAIPATPVGDNGKNAILHDYVVASGAGGAQSVFSLGEIDPSFGGTAAAPYISVVGNSYSLVDPDANASGRDISGLTSLRVVAISDAATGNGKPSSSVALGGLVTDPGQYTLSDLKDDFSPGTENVSGDSYTGVPLWTFLDPSSLIDVTDQIVIVTGTDGYRVVYSLAEIDPSLGGNPADLLPYADTGGNFPADGLARTLFPSDDKHGRWVSDIDGVTVTAVPEPSTSAMMLLGLTGLAALASRRTRIFAAT